MSAVQRAERLSFPFATDSPFLFAVYHDDRYPPGNDKLGPDASLRGRPIGSDFGNPSGWSMYHGEGGVPGFPQHPHRGFETITVTVRGFIDHVDSLGAAGRFGDGDVQWMTAGRGIQHAEMFPCLSRSEPNQLELFQVWLNLPKASKMVPPNFLMLWGEQIPELAEHGARVKLIAGAAPGFATPALAPPPDSYARDARAAMLVLTIKLEPNGTYTVPAAPGAGADVHRNLYVYAGSVTVEGKTYAKQRLKVDASRDLALAAAGGAAGVLLLQGRDIGEPVVQHGPFVGNASSDIRQAFSDYQRTQFGGWPWPSVGVVHGRDEQRFAKYPDGRREERPRRETK